MKIVALAGGVGGAKLADGLQRVVGEALSVIVNTGDDFEWHGLYISPDLDTVLYTLSGIASPDTGWGIAGDTFKSLEMMSDYDADTWFKVGDRDLATHVLRSQMLREGRTLTQVTRALSNALGARPTILPMTDDRVETIVETEGGELKFQEYFVRRRWQPVVKAVRFLGIEEACPSAETINSIAQADVLIICPSNPFVSIAPILALEGIREQIAKSKAIKMAVSPIVGGQAIRGPAAKMFRELGIEPSALAVADRYAGLVDAFMIDKLDEHEAAAIEKLGMHVVVGETIMSTERDRERVGREILDWAASSAAR